MLSQFKHARRASVPLIVIRTPDYASTIKLINEEYAGLRKGKDLVSMLKWDIANGIIAVDGNSQAAAAAVNKDSEGKPPALVTGNVTEALARATDLMPNDSILFMMNMHIPLESRDEDRLAVIQSVWNIRDKFKNSKRTLVLLVPDMKIPPELSNDMIVLDVDLPNAEQLDLIIRGQFKAAQLQEPTPDILNRSIEATIGLSQFTAEQIVAMSLRTDGIDLPSLWSRKKSIIEQTGGLAVHQSDVTFDDIGGLDQIKKFLRKIISGKKRPKLIVLIDEIEKQMGGAGSDTSGTSMDQLSQLLASMQDNKWSGALFPGFPGTGKTETANAMGNEAGGLFIKLDLGGMKDKFVGNSEKLVREAMNMLRAMGGENVFFVGTTNSMDAIKPELKRRFRHGNFFFDLPTKKEQKPIWDIWMKKFNVTDDPDTLDYTGWTGSDIKNVCEFADEFGIPLIEAQNFISPVSKTMGTGVDRLRASAHEKYLSASYEGFYKKPSAPKAKSTQQPGAPGSN